MTYDWAPPTAERSQARFVFRGDVVAMHPLDGGSPLVLMVTNVAINGDDVLIEGLDVVGRLEYAHLYPDTAVEIRERGWVEQVDEHCS